MSEFERPSWQHRAIADYEDRQAARVRADLKRDLLRAPEQREKLQRYAEACAETAAKHRKLAGSGF